METAALRKDNPVEHGTLFFINAANKAETFPPPNEYPHKYSDVELVNAAHKDLDYKRVLYPVLPGSIKIGRKTFVPFCGATSNEIDDAFNVQLDELLSEKVSYCMNHGLRGSDDGINTSNDNGVFSQDYAKQRRQLLFAKQWKRNALNQLLIRHHMAKYGVKNLAETQQRIIQEKRIVEVAAASTPCANANNNNKKSTCHNLLHMKDWRYLGTDYFNKVDELLSTYHDYLYTFQKENARLKHRTSNTSRYFFEILAEAKECERKMYECELFNEEKIYGRRDFISEFQRENQILKRRYRKLYSLSVAYMRRNMDRNQMPQASLSPNGNAMAAVPNDQYLPGNIAVPGNQHGDEFHRRRQHQPLQRHVSNHHTHVLQQINECLHADIMANPTQAVDAGLQEQQDTAMRSSQHHHHHHHMTRGGNFDNYNDQSCAISRATTIPSVVCNSSNCKNTNGHSVDEDDDEQRAASRQQSVSFVTRNLAITNNSSATPCSSNVQDDISTPTRKTSSEGGSRAATCASRACSTGSFNPMDSMGQENCMSNAINSLGGVNKWIYSKMEERGEFDGYHLILHELNSLLFADGNAILGFNSLPHVLDWLDETDATRATIPPSQDHFRDGTMFTTCVYAEIKLMKILQGAVYTLRQRHRQREVYPLILQHILEANNELYELKRKLDSGRCALYKKLKLHWAERNSKWGGFPPLKRGYRLLNMLGKGGFAEVWEVFDPITLTVQAAKLHILSQDMDAIERGNVVMRVKNEIDIHKTCRTHKHIVNMKACFEMGDNMLATILELCDDGDLDHYIKLHAPVPEKLALTWTFQILEGLCYMKTLPEGRVHHCDLKPGNILKHRGDIKLADFGLSKMAPRDCGDVLWGGGGTIWYQPPECLLANVRNTHRVLLTDKIDIWAVGCILYEMLYNCRPFGTAVCKNSLSERIYHETTLGPRFPPSDKVSDECKGLMLRFLAFDPNERPSIEEAMALPIFLTDV